MINCLLKLGCCLALLQLSVAFAKEITISGTVVDTVLETAIGSNPLVKIVPVAACSVTVAAGCTEEEPTRFFAKTDNNGTYTLIANIPDTCTYNLYRFSIDGTNNSAGNFSYFTTYTPDSLPTSFTAHLRSGKSFATDSIASPGYVHGLSYLHRKLIHQQDSIDLTYYMMGTADDPDSLEVTSLCNFSISYVTSSGSLAYETVMGCANAVPYYIYLQKRYYREQKIKLGIPSDLAKRFADFANDRQLTMVFRINSTGTVFKYTFNVIDSTVTTVDETIVRRAPYAPSGSTKASVSLLAKRLSITIAEPGTYTIDLYLPNGKLLHTIAKKQYFARGKHEIALNRTGTLTSTMVLARMTCSGVTWSTVLLSL